MAIKGYSAFPKPPVLLELHYQIVSCHIQDTCWRSLIPLQRCSWCILQPQLTWPCAFVGFQGCLDCFCIHNCTIFFYNFFQRKYIWGFSQIFLLSTGIKNFDDELKFIQVWTIIFLNKVLKKLIFKFREIKKINEFIFRINSLKKKQTKTNHFLFKPVHLTMLLKLAIMKIFTVCQTLAIYIYITQNF